MSRALEDLIGYDLKIPFVLWLELLQSSNTSSLMNDGHI